MTAEKNSGKDSGKDSGKNSEKRNARPNSDGLDGILAIDTLLSAVDSEKGKLWIRGYELEELVAQASFEDVCFLLWEGHLPLKDASKEAGKEDIRALSLEFGRLRLEAFEDLKDLFGTSSERFPQSFREGRGDANDFLQILFSLLPSAASARDGRKQALSRICVAVPYWQRVRKGLEAFAPDPNLDVASDYLRMLSGRAADVAKARALSAYLICICDHALNPSTFAARIAASTGSAYQSALVAALAVLKGPLHGGAPGPVFDMFQAIAASGLSPEEWIRAELKAGRRIMGMGHAVYRVRDPRAAVLERLVADLVTASNAEESAMLKLARDTENAAALVLGERYPGRLLSANVEFYTAILLSAVGLPRDLFTATFALGRSSGWGAHVEEQQLFGRLMRPEARYIGPYHPSSQALSQRE